MIIGISGLAGSGKDAVADVLVKKHNFVRVSLADPLKRICAEVFDWDEERLWGPSEKRNEPDERYYRHTITLRTRQVLEEPEVPPEHIPQYLTPRYALQQLGTEWGRNCYDNVWVEYAVRVAKKLMTGYGYEYSVSEGLRHSLSQNSSPARAVAIPDVRFRNEVEGLKKAGAKLVRVKRPGFEKPRWDHASETEQMQISDSEFDHIIENIGDLHHLGLLTDRMMDFFKGKIREFDEAQENVAPFKRESVV